MIIGFRANCDLLNKRHETSFPLAFNASWLAGVEERQEEGAVLLGVR